MAGDETLPVTGVTLHFDNVYTIASVQAVLLAGLPTSGGISVHQIDRLSPYDWRIQVHARPADFELAAARVRDVLSKGLVERPEDITVNDAPVSVPLETLKGIGQDLSSTVQGAGQAIGNTVSGILGGTSLGTIVIVLGIAAVVVAGLYLSRRPA